MPLTELPWFPIVACEMPLCVTVNVVPDVVALAAFEIVTVVVLGIAVMVTVSELVIVAVRVSVAVAVAAAVKVKLVALVTVAATVSPAGIPAPEMGVPAFQDTGAVVVTVVLPLVMEAVKVLCVVVVLGMPVPLMVIPCVNASVEAVVTVVLPLVVLAEMVEDAPRLTQGLFDEWQATQKVGLADASYWLVPRLGVPATPLTLTLRVSPSWL
jgi:hypothetical protein